MRRSGGRAMIRASLPSLAEQRRYWDERWDRQRLPNDYQRRRGDAVLAMLDSLRLRDPEILDFGCGTGWFTADLARRGRATGIDLSEVAIAQARTAYPQVRFIAGNLYQATFPAEHFDVVVSQEVVAHVEDPARYLAIIARILKPNGHLIITAANRLVSTSRAGSSKGCCAAGSACCGPRASSPSVTAGFSAS